MIRLRGLGVIACLLLVPACAAEDAENAAIDPDVEDRTPYEQLKLAADTGFEAGGASTPVIPVQGRRDPRGITARAPLTVTGTLRSAAANASPPGSVVVSEYGPGTRVQLTVTAYEPGVELQAAIVEGDREPRNECSEHGEVRRLAGAMVKDRACRQRRTPSRTPNRSRCSTRYAKPVFGAHPLYRYAPSTCSPICGHVSPG